LPIILFCLHSSQLGEILPQLNELGFDFAGAIDLAARKKITGNVADEEGTTFEQWKTTEEAQQILNEAQNEEKQTFTAERSDELLREAYNNKKLSGEITEKTNGKNFTSSNIPTTTKSELISDISVEGITKQELYNAYPEVSTSYINSLYNSISPSSSSKTTSSGLSDEEFLEKLSGITQ